MPYGQTVNILNGLLIIPIQVNDTGDIARKNEKFNRKAIDVFLAAQLVPSERSAVAGVARPRGQCESVWVCG